MTFSTKILVVDDEKEMCDLVRAYLEKEGHYVDTIFNGEEAVILAKEKNYDIIILDVMMPGVDGFTVCQRIREFSTTPIIMLTARSDEHDRVMGLKIGADDYVLKPFSPKELVARVEALLRRTAIIQSDTFQVGPIKVKKNARQIFLYDDELSLARREYDLLLFLLEHKGQVFSRNQLYDTVWGNENDIGTLRTVDTHIKTLRYKLKSAGSQIKTVWGVGYKFE